MLTLVNILIVFFIILILYQILLESCIVEGLENQYQPYDTNNPNNALILAQQNAGNISYLKERLDSIQGINQEVQDISGNVVTLQAQVNQLERDLEQIKTQNASNVVKNVVNSVPPQVLEAVQQNPAITEEQVSKVVEETPQSLT